MIKKHCIIDEASKIPENASPVPKNTPDRVSYASLESDVTVDNTFSRELA